MKQDGYVLNLQAVSYPDPDYVAVKAHVKLRTKDKDTLTNADHYSVWVVFVRCACSVKSAFCSCKGGYVNRLNRFTDH